MSEVIKKKKLFERNLITRPSIICGASGARCGFSVTIGTDGVFGIARPRSIIAG